MTLLELGGWACEIQDMESNGVAVPIPQGRVRRLLQQVDERSSSRTHSVRSPTILYIYITIPSYFQLDVRKNRVWMEIATTTLLCSATYLFGLLAPPSMFQLINPRPASPPLAAESEEGKRYTEMIERELLNLKMLKECREKEGEVV